MGRGRHFEPHHQRDGARLQHHSAERDVRPGALKRDRRGHCQGHGLRHDCGPDLCHHHNACDIKRQRRLWRGRGLHGHGHNGLGRTQAGGHGALLCRLGLLGRGHGGLRRQGDHLEHQAAGGQLRDEGSVQDERVVRRQRVFSPDTDRLEGQPGARPELVHRGLRFCRPRREPTGLWHRRRGPGPGHNQLQRRRHSAGSPRHLHRHGQLRRRRRLQRPDQDGHDHHHQA